MSFLDFCLRCDTQTSGEAYCSQRCRLQDMDSGNTPQSSTSDSPYGYYGSNPSGGTAGFYLPPAFDFAAYRHNSTASSSSSSAAAAARRRPSTSSTRRAGSVSTTSSRPTSLYSLTGTSVPSNTGMARYSHDRNASSPGDVVTPSSSQASLVSFSSSTGGRGMSRQAREELRDYTKSFDQVRDLRRRIVNV